MFAPIIDIIKLINAVIFALLILQNASYFVWLALAYAELRRSVRREKKPNLWSMLTKDFTFSISLLVPAHNEETTVVENVHSLLALQYPDFEVVVVNDGSSDRTLETLIEKFDLTKIHRACQLAIPHRRIRGLYGNPRYPRLIVVDKENGGKSDALNAAINLARNPIVCSIDADSVLDADSLIRAMRPFVEEPEQMIAVGGTVRVANGCTVKAGQVIQIMPPRQMLPLFQSVEYLRAFLIARLAWSRLHAMLIISGAFGLFKRNAVIQAGGYSTSTVGEDMELVVKLHRSMREKGIAYQMRYVPDPICWTEAPDTLQVLQRQRTRWQRGLLETLFKHRRMLFNPSYGPVGLVGMPNFLAFDVIGPLLEMTGYVLIPFCGVIGVLSYEFFIAYFMLTFALGICLSVGSLFLAELSAHHSLKPKDLLLLTAGAVVENFGYRQLNNYWRLMGFWQFMRDKQGWGAMPRAGFSRG
ncbi:MAG: glycosyltransferase family 2 protein [Verrucomicrobia bacterium]|nr:glycosyltransferase family 2 protein [Verrucomicrobiota bacterium]